MPAVSKKQARFMSAVAHSKAFAKKAGVPQSVGRDFTLAGIVDNAPESVKKKKKKKA